MILDEICAHTREKVAARKRAVPRSELEEEASALGAPRDFRMALREPGISLIAEIKRASPSKGVLIENGDPIDLAGVYESAGARALSVLTEERYFKGALKDLVSVHKHTRLPCLRKDFILDEYQIYESRCALADAVLLIVKALSQEQLKDYLALAKSLGLASLVETHDADEIARALDAGAHIIGINNRDLTDFSVNIDTTLELRRLVPGGNVLVSESGIRTREDVRRLDEGGVDAVLVGERLVTSNDIGATIKELIGSDDGES